MNSNKVRGLLERLKAGENVIIAEGYMWEFERRGYLQSGGNVPEVVLDNPELVRLMHQEFVHSGSDVVEAFTYYGHRSKLRSIGREGDLERLQRDALKIARDVADETNTLMAGNLCGTGIYSAEDKESHEEARAMFEEQVVWAVEGKCDYIIAETLCYLGEAMIALDVIKSHGVPAVITLTPYGPDETLDHVSFPEACRKLEEAGAAVVGLNCSRGPVTMIPLMKEIRKACKGPIAAVPVPYRTDDKDKTFFSYKDEEGKSLYPLDVSCRLCSRSDVRKFADEARAIGIEYVGLCCGNASNYMRELAEAYDRSPPACKYSPDLSKNIIVGQTGTETNKEIDKIRRFSVGEYVTSDLAKLKLKKTTSEVDMHHEHEEDNHVEQ